MPKKNDTPYSEDVSILSSGVKIEGKIYSEGNVRIDGTVIGDVTVNGNLTLGEASKVKGNVRARNITISGRLNGTANSSEKLILESKSFLKGDLSTKILVVEEGALFEGSSKMGAAKDTEDAGEN